MTPVSGKRRGRGEDSIYWDEAKNRCVGPVNLGDSTSGMRVRKRSRAGPRLRSGTRCMPRKINLATILGGF